MLPQGCVVHYRQGGYVLAAFVCGFVCEFVCEQDNSKTGRILMKFSGYV